MPTYSENLIRIALNVRSNPPLAPVDQLTGDVPAFFRGASVAIQVGIFDIYGILPDLSNIAYLQCAVFPLPVPNQRPCTNLTYAQYSYSPYPTTPPAALLSQTVAGSDLTSNVSIENWENGVAQSAEFIFDWIDTQSLNLGGQPQMRFGFTIQGVTSPDGNGHTRKINYGGGPIEVYESGVIGVYLPNAYPPLDVPDGTILYVEPNQQMLFEQTISVEGTIVIEGLLTQASAVLPPNYVLNEDGSQVLDNDGNPIIAN